LLERIAFHSTLIALVPCGQARKNAPDVNGAHLPAAFETHLLEVCASHTAAFEAHLLEVCASHTHQQGEDVGPRNANGEGDAG